MDKLNKTIGLFYIKVYGKSGRYFLWSNKSKCQKQSLVDSAGQNPPSKPFVAENFTMPLLISLLQGSYQPSGSARFAVMSAVARSVSWRGDSRGFTPIIRPISHDNSALL